MKQRPNILFLMNDHQLHYRHGWDGDVPIHRPHFDRLAKQGIRFNRAYTVCPLCTPARRSILTSLYPHAHGQLQNRPSTPIRNETYLSKLAEQGYQNFAFGKWHAGKGTAVDQGCEGFSLTGYGNPYVTEQYQTYLKKHGLQPPIVKVERDFAHTNPVAAGSWYRQTEPNGCWEHMSGIMVAEDDAHEAFFLANLACEQLDRIANANSLEPFAMRVDFWGPHQPYLPTQAFADLYAPSRIPVYGSFHDTLENKPSTYQRELNAPIGDKSGNLIQPNTLSWSEWQKVLARCYAQISLVDAAGGRIIEKLDSLGFAENTLVIWTADHGDALASHGGHFNKGCYLTEEVLRIPLAIRYPAEIKPEQQTEALVSNLDLAPTMLEAAGTAFSYDVHGRSLIPLIAKNTTWRDSLLAESNGHDDDTIARAILTNRYKYIATKNDLHELYDLQDDPYELDNLIDDPHTERVLARLRTHLRQQQQQTGDPEHELN
ncbi:MAG: sulfatase-like hydrolase/transferase [Chloroflexota bacterium]